MKTLLRFSILLSCLVGLTPTLSLASTQDAIVKVFTTAKTIDYSIPWQSSGMKDSTGSASIIAGQRILTNAHVVSDATYIEVQRNGDPNKYVAEVIAISHEADLALLKVSEDSFFAGVTPLEFDGLPELLDSVVVYGYPEGGEGLSLTKGVVSRIEVTTYVHSWCSFLTLQIDAAINSGNSGGPVLKDGKIVGVAMMNQPKSDNIGYIIPTTIIEHFLEDIEDGRYDGFPNIRLKGQSLENSALRAVVGLPESETGVYINYILAGTDIEGLLFPEDVILSVDKFRIANDNSILLRSGLRVNSNYALSLHQIGEQAEFTVWRKGKKQIVSVPLKQKRIDTLLVKSDQYDHEPEYYILSGLVLTPLSYNYLKPWGENWFSDAPISLLKYCYQDRTSPDEEVVIVGGLLKSQMTKGYENASEYARIISVNGKKVRNFRHLASLIDTALTKDDMIILGTEEHAVIAISPKLHRENEKQLLELYGINESKRVHGNNMPFVMR